MEEILQVARERAKGTSNLDFKVSEEYSLPVENKSADCVFICNVIHET